MILPGDSVNRSNFEFFRCALACVLARLWSLRQGNRDEVRRVFIRSPKS
jgi:hypothetical protein